MSLRELLWDKIFGRNLGLEAMPEALSSPEIIVALVLGLLWVAISWFALKRAFFLLSEHAWASRISAIVFGLSMATAWILGSLELAGFYSTKWMLILSILSTLSICGYLALERGK